MLEQGRIIWATLSDRNGRNSKSRPLVVVTPTADIPTAEALVAVAISTTPNPNDNPFEVPLPWSANGKARTKLTKSCAAVCNWLCKVVPVAIQAEGGVVPPSELAEIMRRIDQLRASEESTTPPDVCPETQASIEPPPNRGRQDTC